MSASRAILVAMRRWLSILMLGLMLTPSVSLWACGQGVATVAESVDCCRVMQSKCAQPSNGHAADPCCLHHPQQARVVLAAAAVQVRLVPTLQMVASIVASACAPLRRHVWTLSTAPPHQLHSILLV